MDPIGGPLSPGRGGGGGLTAAEAEIQTIRQEQLRRHLDTAGKIPSGIKETSLGSENLTTGQREGLTRFKGKGKEFKNPKVINYSDGSAIYSSKVPARDIPGSYALYEKHVDAGGKIIKTNKIVVGPNGELVHIKPK